MDHYLACWQKYFEFAGRAHRDEFWFFVLFNTVFGLAISFLDFVLGTTDGSGNGVLSGLYSLLVLIPSMAVGARRLHDTNRSGWWQLLLFIPLLGFLILVFWWASEGDSGENTHGEDPRRVA